jgi:hypothetical protein
VAAARSAGTLLGLALQFFLAWRVSRGGEVSWILLVLLSVWDAAIIGVAVIVVGGAYLIGLFAFNLAAVALITSPAARGRLRPSRRRESA